MTLFNMDSEKMYLGEYWTNRYTIQASNLDAAVTVAAAIREVEKAASLSVVSLTRYRVSDRTPMTDVYQIVEDNQAGARSPTSDPLPLFCRVRCQFNTAGGGRPSRKYWLPPVQEDETASTDLISAAVSFYMSTYVNPLIAIAGFVDTDGQVFTSGSVTKRVGMRQLRRASKRRLHVIPIPG